MTERFLPALVGTDYTVEVQYEEGINVVYLMKPSGDPEWDELELVASETLYVDTSTGLNNKVAAMIAKIPARLVGTYVGNTELEEIEQHDEAISSINDHTHQPGT